VDFSYYAVGIGRFRTNVFQQRGDLAMAMRYVKTQVPSFEELGLLPILQGLAETPRGIILLAGTTGAASPPRWPP
jgi:Tfp pilus assembly pilus retraction ATPase PilT